MRSKGFTLIELLAVIVILAIIALIVVPIVLNIIDDADRESEADSAKMYIHAVELAIAKTNMSTRLANATCTVQVGGNLTCDGKDIEVDINNKDQIKGGTITIERRKVTKVTNLKVGNGTYNMGSDGKLVLSDGTEAQKPCTLNDKDGNGEASLSDEITCDTESFYVMSTDGSTITMLSKYNLDVGNIAAPDNNCTGKCELILTPISNPTGIQKAEARGRVDGQDTSYGTIAFSETNYWWDKGTIKSTYPTTSTYSINSTQYNVAYIYDSNSKLYNYVNEYANKLKEKGVSSATATLMSYEQATSLGCARNDNEHYGWCSAKDNNNNTTNGTAPEWLYSTTYWLGSSDPFDGRIVWLVSSFGSFGFVDFDSGSYAGVRPVVNISTSEI